MSVNDVRRALEEKIACLESELLNARVQLKRLPCIKPISNAGTSELLEGVEASSNVELELHEKLPFDKLCLPSHPLLHLTDTALPLGSFAFSSGLESFLSHHSPAQNARPNIFHHFLHWSLMSLGSATLPYLIAVYKDPQQLEELDDTLDACTLCPVAKRASLSQGRALITIWERSLKAEAASSAAREALRRLSVSLRGPASAGSDGEPVLNAHFPMVYAVICAAQGLSLNETAYTYVFNHTKAVVSAAVRASVLGPYAAQGILASKWLRAEIEDILEREWDKSVDEAGQAVPTLDVWMGRHELLYSRIFNS